MKSIFKNPPAYVVMFAVIPSATTAIWVRISDAPSLAVASWRMIFSTILCIPFLIIERKEIKNVSRRDFLLCVLSGFFLALHFSTWLAAINLTTVAAAASLVATAPIFVAVINAALFRKKPGRVMIISLIAAITGSVSIALGGGDAAFGTLNGNMLAVAGAVTAAAYLVTGSFVRKTVTSGIYVSIVFAVSALFLMLFCIVAGIPFGTYSSNTYLAIFAMAVFCSIGGHVMFNWLIKYHGAMLISLAILSEPVFASTYAFFLFDEVPSAATVAGAVMIISGLAYYIRKGQE